MMVLQLTAMTTLLMMVLQMMTTFIRPFSILLKVHFKFLMLFACL